MLNTGKQKLVKLKQSKTTKHELKRFKPAHLFKYFS